MRALLRAFQRDHAHLLALTAASRRELEEATPRAAETVGALAGRLRRHLRFEEESLFPAVERVVGDPEFHVTATLRREHRMLRELLADVESALALDNLAGAVGNLFELEAALRTHEAKERRVLYPMADRVALSSERAVLEALEAAS